LAQLQAWLTAKGKSSLCVPVIDMYPERMAGSLTAAAISPSLKKLIEESPYFDAESVLE
jgi:hypothetical protein